MALAKLMATTAMAIMASRSMAMAIMQYIGMAITKMLPGRPSLKPAFSITAATVSRPTFQQHH